MIINKVSIQVGMPQYGSLERTRREKRKREAIVHTAPVRGLQSPSTATFHEHEKTTKREMSSFVYANQTQQLPNISRDSLSVREPVRLWWML